MTSKRIFALRWLAIAVVAYISCWLLTYFFGAKQVRREIIASMPVNSSFTDVSYSNSTVHPLYWCRVKVYAPFLVYADYGWSQAPLAGGGGSDLHCWIFGATFHICDFSIWMA